MLISNQLWFGNAVVNCVRPLELWFSLGHNCSTDNQELNPNVAFKLSWNFYFIVVDRLRPRSGQ